MSCIQKNAIAAYAHAFLLLDVHILTLRPSFVTSDKNTVKVTEEAYV
jgi:hypothetical protein